MMLADTHVRARAALVACALLLAAGCASLPAGPAAGAAGATAQARACSDWFAALDAAVDRSGVRDAGAHRVEGFPFLRTDRFLASFRDRARADDAAFSDWVARLRALDEQARAAELRNLPNQELASLGADGRDAVLARTGACAETLQHDLLASPEDRARVLAGASVPDDYSGWQRALGLYAVTRVPFSAGVRRWHEEVETMFHQAAANSSVDGEVQRFGPPRGTEARDPAAILAGASRDALGIPRLGDAECEALFAAFAPVYEVEGGGSAHDRFGPLQWGEALAPMVAVSKPTVYRRLAYTRHGDAALVQLVYTVWFSERPPAGAVDLLAGALDGVVMRVTLGPDGAPLVWDTIHPCGCYHMFFPTTRVRARPAPDPADEWALIPARLPAPPPGARLHVRIASGSHYVVGVDWKAAQADGGQRYAVADEDSLRAVPVAGGGSRSIYGPDGLVPGTERAERLYFWPMGIASAGAMRQWGRHATAFLGRRHFDDADLIERRFEIVAP